MLKFLILLPLNLALTVFNFLFCWAIALFVRSDYTMPRWLSWFSTSDALMNGKGTRPGGGGGDSGFYQRHLNDSRWWTATCWLCRNPINGFDESVCKGTVDRRIVVIGDSDMNTDDNFLFRFSHMGIRSFIDRPFELYIKWRYCKWLMARLRVGWKLSEFIESEGLTGYAQYVFVPNPAKRP